jgi:peptide/nickel transport system substrate-binding protein
MMEQDKVITRRAFLHTGVGLGAATLVGSHGARPAAAQETPRRGGALRFATGASPDTFDPVRVVLYESVAVQDHIYSGLTRVNAKMEVEPDLAKAFEANATADQWRFALRSGVRFHHGKDCSSRDVVASFERLLDAKVASPARTALKGIARVEAAGADTVLFHLAEPNADFPALMGNRFAKIVPVDRIESLATSPSGTGPYTLASHNPGERTVLKRFDGYFDPDQGFLDEIRLLVIPDESTRVASLTSGTTDLMIDLTAAAYARLQGAKGVRLFEVDTGSYQPVAVHLDQPPFTDARIARALKLCVNRETIVRTVYSGHAVAAADQPLPPIDPMYANLPIPKPEIERARELLREAGHPNGLDLVLHSSSGRAGMMEVAVAVQEQAKAAGFRIRIQDEPIQTYWSTIWLKRPMFVGSWFGRATADEVISTQFASDAVYNESHYANKQLDALTKEARGTLDRKRRRELYARIQKLIAEESGVVVHSFRRTSTASTDKLRGFAWHPLSLVHLHRAWLQS